ncbi:MAG: GrrA/OscA1 family cyclophane-containing rSAM-modified RiPP [Cyanobacteriota bacterium]|nr:GrrA/OscA1 family cyclophane-containing rSAM-modified RiPP [Cyanobacteriota bacterium]
MAFPSRPHLLGLLLLLALPPEGTAALAMLRTSIEDGGAPHSALEQRLQRIQAAVQERRPPADPADADADAGSVALNGVDPAAGAEAAGADPAAGDGRLAYTFVNGPGIGWGNGGFRNGGFYNGGFRNGGAWGNGGGGWRNGGFRNHW